MFVLVRSASLSLELGAHLLEELGQTSARDWPRRAHAAMRVVHFRYGSVAMARGVFSVKRYFEGGCLAVCGPDCGATAFSLVAAGAGRQTSTGGRILIDQQDRHAIRRGRFLILMSRSSGGRRVWMRAVCLGAARAGVD